MSSAILYVVDATAVLFRAYYGMNSLSSPDGVEVGGVLGVCQWLVRFVRAVRPRFVTCVFDAGAVTFRNELYPPYKANRGEPPEDLVPQFELAFEATEALGFRSFRIPGYEADDLMATIASRGSKAGVRTILITPDKDVAQLIDSDVKVMDPKDFGIVDAEAVHRKFGVAPEQLADLLALAGDSTDNIPGVAGVGPKTASALIQAFGSLDQLYASLESVPDLPIRGAKTLPAKLTASREDVYLFRDLVRLSTEAPLSEDAMTLGMLGFEGPRIDADALFDRLGFHGPLRSLRGTGGTSHAPRSGGE